jgi:hypothetical protein
MFEMLFTFATQIIFEKIMMIVAIIGNFLDLYMPPPMNQTTP